MTTRRSARRSRWSVSEKREFVKGLVFISPWLIGLLAFVLYPIVASMYYSLTSYDLLRAPSFVGLQNYWEILFKDPMIGKMLYNTAYFVFFGVPLGTITAFLLASLLNTKLVGRSVFRAIFYLPSIVPVVSSAMVWMWLLNTQYGAINSVLASANLPVIPFITNPDWVKPSFIAIHCWASGGAMLIFLASLRDVPASLYDAAKVDGAGSWARFRHITIPMCTPAILFSVLTGIIDGFQTFSFAWILTRGGPNGATEFYSVYLYRNAFAFLRMGYASALAWILFLIVMVVTLAVFRSSGGWVYYGGGN